MSRIAQRFHALRHDKRKALIPYVTAGDPQPLVTVPLMHAMVEGGADIIELGIPFSDPMADGPVIQAACERALAHHVTLQQVLSMVQQFRAHDEQTPVVLMGYLNPIEVMGYEAFAKAAQDAGVDGVLIVDLPPEEAEELSAILHAHEVDPIFLLAPNSPPERIRRICDAARGFVYYVSLKGVTGSASLASDTVAHKVAEIRAVTTLPVGVGFGIRDARAAAQIAQIADAVVIGSVLVAKIADLAEAPSQIASQIGAFVSEIRNAIDHYQHEGTVS